ESSEPPMTAKQLSRNFHRLAAYNRDATWDPREFAAIAREEQARIAQARIAPPNVIEAVSSSLLPHFARADQLAGRYHALRNFVTAFVPAVSALAVSLMTLQILFWPEHHVVAALEILLLTIGYLSYRLSVREAWHEKWLYDRHLAERLRCLLYTFAVPAGLPEPPLGRRLVNIHQLPFYEPANDWFMATLSRIAARLRRDV